MTLAEQMIRFRALNNLTQQQLADMVGVTKLTILMIENGKRMPTKVNEVKIRMAIGEK